MLYSRHPSAQAHFWPRLAWPSLLAALVIAVSLGAQTRAADPPSLDPVDDFRAAFRKDVDKIAFLSFDIPFLRDAENKLKGDPKKLAELAMAHEKVDKAEKELATAFDSRSATLQKRIKDELAKGDVADRVALATILGDEAMRLQYPTTKLSPDHLAKLHPEVPVLIELTEDKPNNTLQIRETAALALGKTYGDPTTVIPALAKLLRDRRNPVSLRLAAAEALGKPIHLILHPPAPRNVDQYSKTPPPTPERLNSTNLRLVLLDTSHLALPVLRDGLRDESPAVRQASVNGCKDISSSFLTQIPGDPLEEQDPIKARKNELAQVAITKEFLREFGDVLKVFNDEMPKLAPALEDKDAVVRKRSLSILEDLATARLQIAKNLALEFRPKPTTRRLERIMPDLLPSQLPTTLTPVAFMDDPEKARAPVEPPPEKPDVLSGALKASLPGLARSLKHPDVETRRTAAFVLEAIGADAAAVIPDLIVALSDKDASVRWTAIRILGRLAPKEAKQAVPALIRRLPERDIDIRLAAVKALEQYGKEAKNASPALAEMLANGDVAVDLAALKAIQAVSVGEAPTLAAIVDLLQHPEANVRIKAAETLGRFGKDAVKTRPALEKALNDEDENVRTAAAEALLRVKK